MKKILMHSSTYPTPDTQSTGLFVSNMIHGMLKEDKELEISVLTMSHTGKFNKYIKMDRLTVIQYPYSFLLQPQFHIGIFNGVKSPIGMLQFVQYIVLTAYMLVKELAQNNYDILHLQWMVPEAIVATLFKPIHKTPIIITAQGAEYHLQNLPGLVGKLCKKFTWVLTCIFNFIYKRTEHIVFVSNYMYHMATTYKPCKLSGDHSIIPNCVDSSKFKRTKKFSVQDQYIIVVVGRLAPEKHLDDLIKAVDLLPETLRNNIRVWFIGMGPSEKKLKDLTHSLNLEKIIKFKGFIQNDKLPEILSKVHVYVKTSTQEGLSTANVENQMLGIPSIVTKGYGNDEVVIDNETGYLYEARNVVALAEKIIQILANKEKMVVFSNNAIKNSRQFDFARIGKKYIELYDKLATQDN